MGKIYFIKSCLIQALWHTREAENTGAAMKRALIIDLKYLYGNKT